MTMLRPLSNNRSSSAIINATPLCSLRRDVVLFKFTIVLGCMLSPLVVHAHIARVDDNGHAFNFVSSAVESVAESRNRAAGWIGASYQRSPHRLNRVEIVIRSVVFPLIIQGRIVLRK